MKPLNATGYDTDKGCHYLDVYERLFAPLLDQDIRLLELGVLRGGSLLLWRDHFPRGIIVGLDAEEVDVADQSGRIRVFRGLQQDTAVLRHVAGEVAPDGFDFIIDDASHIGDYTRISFWHLFSHHLKPGGIYVIEDWGTGYWKSWPDGAAYMGPLMTDSVELSGSSGSPAGASSPAPIRASHLHGMVGFVKELVDECGMGDITSPKWTGNSYRPSRIARMEISHGLVVVIKAGSSR